MLSIDNHVTLQSKTLKELGLSLWACFSHFDNSFRIHGLYCLLEVWDFNINELLLASDLEVNFLFFNLDLFIILLLNKIEFSLFLDSTRVNYELGLLDFCMSLDQVCLGLSLGIGDSKTSWSYSIVFSSLLPLNDHRSFIRNLRLNALSEKHSGGLLLMLLSFVFCFSLLWFCLNLEGHINWFLERFASLFLYWVDWLDINLSDIKIVSFNVEGKEVAIFILFMNSILDDFCWIFMEMIERYTLDGTSDSWRNSLASITDEVHDSKKILALISISLVKLKVPSVR